MSEPTKCHRVYYRTTTTVESYVDVEACTSGEAADKASMATEGSDDVLVMMEETYDYDCGPTGEIKELNEGEDE